MGNIYRFSTKVEDFMRKVKDFIKKIFKMLKTSLKINRFADRIYRKIKKCNIKYVKYKRLTEKVE